MWRIYYEQGSVSSENYAPQNVPALGVIAIAQPPDKGHRAEYSCDFYWWYPVLERWVGGDQYGMLDYMIRPGWKKVLYGRTVEPDVYNAIVNQALNDPIGDKT